MNRDLRAVFRDVPAVPFEGTAYRICLALYARQTVSMRGSFAHGGRFNIPAYFGCLYMSLRAETARAELARYFSVPPDCGFVEAAIRLRLSRVVDLTDGAVLRWAGITRETLTGPHTATRELGLRAWEAGIEALLVPSAAVDGAANVAVFLDNQTPRWSVGLLQVAPAGPAIPRPGEL